MSTTQEFNIKKNADAQIFSSFVPYSLSMGAIIGLVAGRLDRQTDFEFFLSFHAECL